jgi:hypothetical protein
MEHMRAHELGTRAFAVGFVSVMAGTMLAAQTFKEALGEGPLGGVVSRAVMQFVDPLAVTNRRACTGATQRARCAGRRLPPARSGRTATASPAADQRPEQGYPRDAISVCG